MWHWKASLNLGEQTWHGVNEHQRTGVVFTALFSWLPPYPIPSCTVPCLGVMDILPLLLFRGCRLPVGLGKESSLYTCSASEWMAGERSHPSNMGYYSKCLCRFASRITVINICWDCFKWNNIWSNASSSFLVGNNLENGHMCLVNQHYIIKKLIFQWFLVNFLLISLLLGCLEQTELQKCFLHMQASPPNTKMMLASSIPTHFKLWCLRPSLDDKGILGQALPDFHGDFHLKGLA